MGIGTALPMNKLEVVTDGELAGGAGGQMQAALLVTNNGTGRSARFSGGSGVAITEGLTVDFAGVGTNPNVNNYALIVKQDQESFPNSQGAALFLGTIFHTGIQNVSDRKFKRDIRALEGTDTDKLLSLNTYRYKFKTEEFGELNFPSEEQYGFIADELKMLFPNLVKHATIPSDDPNTPEKLLEYESVNYTGLIPVLVKAVQMLNDKVEEQEKLIQQLLNDQKAK